MNFSAMVLAMATGRTIARRGYDRAASFGRPVAPGPDNHGASASAQLPYGLVPPYGQHPLERPKLQSERLHERPVAVLRRLERLEVPDDGGHAMLLNEQLRAEEGVRVQRRSASLGFGPLRKRRDVFQRHRRRADRQLAKRRQHVLFQGVEGTEA